MNTEHPRPFVSETLGSRSMYFSCSAVQSSMNLMQPDALVLEYTQTMMGFLKFAPSPARIAMVGLGGGSIAKFCHRYLPRTRMTVVEINPHVIALRDRFLIPPDGERFTVIEGDGAQFVRQAPGAFDVLILDGFEVGGMPPTLSSLGFYEDCLAALQPKGILVANLHTEDPDYEAYVDRIRRVFGQAVVVEEPESAQSTVFASKEQALVRPEHKNTRPAKLPDAAWTQLEGAFAHIDRVLRTLHK
ncbi:MAG: fused MFS/spermidine synthase [Acidobacteriota bacterium]